MTILTGIRDLNNELVDLDFDKPIIFVDIDGVVNPLRFEREWIGDRDGSLADAKNWKWNELAHDPIFHYDVTRSIDVELDMWQLERPLHPKPELRKDGFRRYRRVKLLLMDEMLTALRAIAKKHEAQIVYLTWWRSEALRLLEPELNLGAIGYLDWYVGSFTDHRSKISALRELYVANSLKNPFIVLDDESLVGLRQEQDLWVPKNSFAEAELELYRQLNSIPKLYVEPDYRWGVERKQIHAIEDFLDKL